jgi:hypothetical protein
MKISNIRGLLFAGAVVFLGMCLPWMTIVQRGFSISISGWKGTANIGGVPLPGFFVAAAAAAAVIGTLGQAKNQWKWNLPKLIPISLCIYGFVHTGFMAIALGRTPEMNIGIGVFVTLFGLAVLLVATWSVYSTSAVDASFRPSTGDASD